MEKRSPEEILQAIEDASLDDEMDRVLAMTPEERRRELAEAGVDLGEVDAAADAMYEKMQAEGEPRSEPGPVVEAPVAPVLPIARSRRWQRAVWLSAAAAVVLLVGAVGLTAGPAIVAWWRGTPEPIQRDNERPRPPSPRELAEKARDEADQACAAQRLGTCRDKLDEARKLDPAGESEDRVQRMRGVISDSMRQAPPDDKPRRR